MNIADYTAIVIIAACIGIGITIGSIRGLAIFLGIFFAFQFAGTQIQKGLGHYVGVWLGVAVIISVVGFLLYGSTRITLIDSLEGVFGAVLGLCAGWGIVKFIFTLYIVFQPQHPFTGTILSSMTGWDIYTVSPVMELLNRTENLRKPNWNGTL